MAETLSKEALDKLRVIAHNAVDSDGNVKSFDEQLDAFAYGEMASGDMFVVAPSSSEAGLSECPDLPITMRQSIVKKITAAHELLLADLKKLSEWLKDHPLAMESLTEPNSIVVIADTVDHEGRDILIALHLEKDYQQVRVNDIGSIYGKNNLAYLVENTINAGKEIYVNSRTGDWILRTGVPFPEQIANHLQSLLYQKYPDRAERNAAVTGFAETQLASTPEPSVGKWVGYENEFGMKQTLMFGSSHYYDGNCAIVMWGYDADLGSWVNYGTCTKNLNLDDSPSSLPPNQAYLDTNNCEHLCKLLFDQGWAAPTGVEEQSGFCSYPLVEFTDEFLGEVCFGFGIEPSGQPSVLSDRYIDYIDAPVKPQAKPKPSKAAPAPKPKKATTPADDAKAASAQAQARSTSRKSPSEGKVK